jgi:hypothetical protein
MKRYIFAFVVVLMMCDFSPATAAEAPFGCEARTPNVCYFRIFFARRDRVVILPAGMKTNVPGIKLGSDNYCLDIGKKPTFKCTRKLINDKYNS